MWYSTVGCIVTLTLRLLTAPLASEAPQAEKVHQIGLLGLGCTDSPRNQYHREVFLQGLRAFGWVEGQNLAVACRSPRGRAELLPDLAAELVQLKVEVIVTGGERQSLAAKHATSTIPIVMAVSAAPVETGLVANLAQPGGNVTGLSIMAPEGGGKRLELLKDAVPQASRVAVLWNAAIPGKALEWQATQAAAQTVGVTLHSVEVRGPDDFDAAFVTIARERPDALIVFSEPVAAAHQRRIVDFATQHRLPMISETEEFAEMGALMTYGASLPALIRRAAYYVDRILKGAKPADLPVEQPRELALVINRTTAQALGLTLPPHLLFLADRVIQ